MNMAAAASNNFPMQYQQQQPPDYARKLYESLAERQMALPTTIPNYPDLVRNESREFRPAPIPSPRMNHREPAPIQRNEQPEVVYAQPNKQRHLTDRLVYYPSSAVDYNPAVVNYHQQRAVERPLPPRPSCSDDDYEAYEHVRHSKSKGMKKFNKIATWIPDKFNKITKHRRSHSLPDNVEHSPQRSQYMATRKSSGGQAESSRSKLLKNKLKKNMTKMSSFMSKAGKGIYRRHSFTHHPPDYDDVSSGSSHAPQRPGAFL